MKILIRFGDNDFFYTMRAFGRVLLQDFHPSGKPEEYLTKEHIVWLWNELAPGLYMLAQNQWRYSCAPKDVKHTRKYLQITEKQVFLGEEAAEYITANQNGWNGEWLFVVTDAPGGGYLEIV